MHYQASIHTKTDPLDAILDHIWRDPHTYTNKGISNERDDNKNIHGEHEVRNNLQGSEEKQTEEAYSNTRVVSEHINEGGNIVKTDMEGLWRSQTDSCTSNSTWIFAQATCQVLWKMWNGYCLHQHKRNTFAFDFFVQPADHQTYCTVLCTHLTHSH